MDEDTILVKYVVFVLLHNSLIPRNIQPRSTSTIRQQMSVKAHDLRETKAYCRNNFRTMFVTVCRNYKLTRSKHKNTWRKCTNAITIQTTKYGDIYLHKSCSKKTAVFRPHETANEWQQKHYLQQVLADGVDNGFT